MVEFKCDFLLRFFKEPPYANPDFGETQDFQELSSLIRKCMCEYLSFHQQESAPLHLEPSEEIRQQVESNTRME